MIFHFGSRSRPRVSGLSPKQPPTTDPILNILQGFLKKPPNILSARPVLGQMLLIYSNNTRQMLKHIPTAAPAENTLEYLEPYSWELFLFRTFARRPPYSAKIWPTFGRCLLNLAEFGDPRASIAQLTLPGAVVEEVSRIFGAIVHGPAGRRACF